MTLRTLNYGNYGIFLIMGNAGFSPSTVCPLPLQVGFKARGLELSTLEFARIHVGVSET